MFSAGKNLISQQNATVAIETPPVVDPIDELIPEPGNPGGGGGGGGGTVTDGPGNELDDPDDEVPVDSPMDPKDPETAPEFPGEYDPEDSGGYEKYTLDSRNPRLWLCLKNTGVESVIVASPNLADFWDLPTNITGRINQIVSDGRGVIVALTDTGIYQCLNAWDQFQDPAFESLSFQSVSNNISMKSLDYGDGLFVAVGGDTVCVIGSISNNVKEYFLAGAISLEHVKYADKVWVLVSHDSPTTSSAFYAKDPLIENEWTNIALEGFQQAGALDGRVMISAEYEVPQETITPRWIGGNIAELEEDREYSVYEAEKDWFAPSTDEDNYAFSINEQFRIYFPNFDNETAKSRGIVPAELSQAQYLEQARLRFNFGEEPHEAFGSAKIASGRQVFTPTSAQNIKLLNCIEDIGQTPFSSGKANFYFYWTGSYKSEREVVVLDGNGDKDKRFSILGYPYPPNQGYFDESTLTIDIQNKPSYVGEYLYANQAGALPLNPSTYFANIKDNQKNIRSARLSRLNSVEFPSSAETKVDITLGEANNSDFLRFGVGGALDSTIRNTTFSIKVDFPTPLTRKTRIGFNTAFGTYVRTGTKPLTSQVRVGLRQINNTAISSYNESLGGVFAIDSRLEENSSGYLVLKAANDAPGVNGHKTANCGFGFDLLGSPETPITSMVFQFIGPASGSTSQRVFKRRYITDADQNWEAKVDFLFYNDGWMDYNFTGTFSADQQKITGKIVNTDWDGEELDFSWNAPVSMRTALGAGITQFNTRLEGIPIGFVFSLYDFASQQKWEVEMDENFSPIYNPDPVDGVIRVELKSTSWGSSSFVKYPESKINFVWPVDQGNFYEDMDYKNGAVGEISFDVGFEEYDADVIEINPYEFTPDEEAEDPYEGSIRNVTTKIKPYLDNGDGERTVAPYFEVSYFMSGNQYFPRAPFVQGIWEGGDDMLPDGYLFGIDNTGKLNVAHEDLPDVNLFEDFIPVYSSGAVFEKPFVHTVFDQQNDIAIAVGAKPIDATYSKTNVIWNSFSTGLESTERVYRAGYRYVFSGPYGAGFGVSSHKYMTPIAPVPASLSFFATSFCSVEGTITDPVETIEETFTGTLGDEGAPNWARAFKMNSGSLGTFIQGSNTLLTNKRTYVRKFS